MTTLVEYKAEPNYTLITLDDGKANALVSRCWRNCSGAGYGGAGRQGGHHLRQAGKFSAGFDLCR